MAERLLRVATFAAAAVVYKTERTFRRQTDEIKNCPQCNYEALRKSRIENAIAKAREQIRRLKNEVGVPGIVVGVSVDGEVVWKEGIGFSDLENQVPANEETVMRIASISKSLTAAVVGRLWQEGKIDLDQPIQKYIPSFPEKTYAGTKVTITTKQLMCHLSGIRHYSKMKKDDAVGAGDGQLQEFYSKEKYDTVEKSLSIFKDDELIHYPGTKYLYTTYGWTVVSAVMEGATGKTYPRLMRNFLRDMGMRKTYLDENEPIIYGRSRYYGTNKNGKIINSPFVDNSCKWAGGGILSTVGDLLKFSNAMLYAYQCGGSVDVSKSKQEVGVIKEKIKLKIKMPWKKDEDQKNIRERNDVKVDYNVDRPSPKTEGAVKVDYNVGRPSPKTEGAESDGTNVSPLDSAHSDTNFGTKIDILKEVGGYAGSAVKTVGQGVSTAGSYVWDSMWSMYGKKEGEFADNEKENRVSYLDRIKDVGSSAGSAVKTAGQGVNTAGSYVWDSMWSMYGKKEGESADNEEENRVSNLDRIKEVGSEAGSVVKTVGQGVNTAGSYVWDSMWSMYGKKERESADNEEENRVSNLDRIKEVGSEAGSVVKTVDQGVSTAGSYVWDSMWSMYGKKEGESADSEKENRVSYLDRVKDVGSSAGSAVKTVSQGVSTAGSYVWDSMWSMYGKKEGEFADNEKENRVSYLDRIKDVGSSAGSAVKTAGQGVNTAGSYVWDSMWSMYGKKERESADNEEENRVSNLDRIKEVGSEAGSVVKTVDQGVSTAGSYVWDSMWSMYGKKEGESADSEKENRVSYLDRVKDVGSSAGSAVKTVSQGVSTAGSYVWDSMWSMYGKKEEESADNEKENRVSYLDRIKDVGSSAGSAVKTTGQGVSTAGSYVWDSMWSMYGKKEGESADSEKENRVSYLDRVKDVGSSAGSAVKTAGQGVTSAGNYIRSKVSSGNESEKEDKGLNKQSESSDMKNNQNESNISWAYLKNIFSPRALNSFDTEDLNDKYLSNEKLSVSTPMDGKVFRGILLKNIIPHTVMLVFGLKYPDISDSRAEFIKAHSGDSTRGNEMETLSPLGDSSTRNETEPLSPSGDSSRRNETEPLSQLCKLHATAAENDQQKNIQKSVNRSYISQKTVATLWTRVENTKFSDWGQYAEGGYGLGFGVAPAVDSPGGVVDGGQPFMIGHTGGAVGASSAFIVMPRDCDGGDPPKGVAVVILANLQSVSLNPLAIEITRIFANATQ